MGRRNPQTVGFDPIQHVGESERPRSLLLSLGVPSRPSAWVLSWARPGPIPGPRGSRPHSLCASFYSISDPSRSRGGGHPRPVLVPSCSRAFLPGSGLDGPKQTSWPLPREGGWQRGGVLTESNLPTCVDLDSTRQWGGCDGFGSYELFGLKALRWSPPPPKFKPCPGQSAEMCWRIFVV